MKPLFTIHEGEFLVGDRINRGLGRKFEVWVPTKDDGVDLLVTRKDRRGRAVGLQVKFSRSFPIREEFARHLVATSWYLGGHPKPAINRHLKTGHSLRS